METTKPRMQPPFEVTRSGGVADFSGSCEMGAAGDLLLFTAIRYSFLACHLLPVSAFAFGTHSAGVRWLVHSC